MILHLAKKARKELLAAAPELELTHLKSENWLKHSNLAYIEIEQINRRLLNSSQAEQLDRLQFFLLLLERDLQTLARVNSLIKLLRGAMKHKSSGKKRSEANRDMLAARDRWLKREATEKKKNNPHISVSNVAKILAGNKSAFKTRGFRPVGSEQIRKVIRSGSK